jgi:hypothetical protein
MVASAVVLLALSSTIPERVSAISARQANPSGEWRVYVLCLDANYCKNHGIPQNGWQPVKQPVKLSLSQNSAQTFTGTNGFKRVDIYSYVADKAKQLINLAWPAIQNGTSMCGEVLQVQGSNITPIYKTEWDRLSGSAKATTTSGVFWTDNSPRVDCKPVKHRSIER